MRGTSSQNSGTLRGSSGVITGEPNEGGAVPSLLVLLSWFIALFGTALSELSSVEDPCVMVKHTLLSVHDDYLCFTVYRFLYRFLLVPSLGTIPTIYPLMIIMLLYAAQIQAHLHNYAHK